MIQKQVIGFDIIRVSAERERERWASPCTKDGCAATITTRYGVGMGLTNIVSLGHYPMTAIIEVM